jgi:hypothetical protein
VTLSRLILVVNYKVGEPDEGENVVSKNLIKALRTERGLLANQIARLDAALDGRCNHSNGTVPVESERHTLSKVGLKISTAQKARWAKSEQVSRTESPCSVKHMDGG